MTNQLNQAFSAPDIVPARVINIAVDTVSLYSQASGQFAGKGVYMMDNNYIKDHSREGTLDLHSTVTAGFGVGFNVFPIDAAGKQGDIVEIVDIQLTSGTNIFGNSGYPKPSKGSYQWLGTAMKQGQCTYQLKIGVSIAGAPMQYYWWDPFLTCTD